MAKNNIRITIAVILAVLMLLIGCGSNDDDSNNDNRGNDNSGQTSPEENNTRQTYPEGEDILKLAWDSSIDGDIHFTIDPVDDRFDITVERYGGQPVDQVIGLTQETEATVYDLVVDIFNQAVNLYDFGNPHSENGSPSRSVTLTFTGNQELMIETIYPSQLDLIYNFVVDTVDPLYSEYPKGRIERMVWDTSGGGDIRFTVEPAGDQFEITVNRAGGQAVDFVIPLTETDSGVYEETEGIFDQTIDLNDYAERPWGETGTWTSITLIFSGNQEMTVHNISAGQLSIDDFVEEYIADQ